MHLWFRPKRFRRAANVTGWWFNPNTNQAIAVPGNTIHHRYLEKNPKLFLEPGETVQNNGILNRWVQIRYYPSSRLLALHFPQPIPPGYFRKTQDFLIGKVEPQKVGVGSHANLGALVEKPYIDFLNADSYKEFINPSRQSLAKRIELNHFREDHP